MKHIFTISLFCFSALNLSAQKETIDLITFNAPGGWKKEIKDGVISYFTVDKASGSWCRLNVYKSVPSKGSIEADLAKEWNELVAMPNNIKDPMQASATEEGDGWKIKAASGKFVFNKKPAAALITTFSGYNRCASIVALTNGQRYLDTIQNFISTINIKKPEAENSVQSNTISSGAGSFTYNTTNFDDGWTSVIKEEWVEVTKGDTKVLLFYALPYDGNMFSGTGLRDRDYYWDNYVTKYFNVQTKRYNDNGEIMTGLQPAYVEGWAVDKQTNKKRFIAMRLSVAPNTAYLTVAAAPDEASLQQQFPNAHGQYTSDLSDMSRYNKFAITINDIAGTWQKGNTSTMQWYYVHPSGYESYAGMTVAATSAVFTFNTNGTYTSTHNGATGAVGNMSTFQQEYKGKITVANWSITATNRWQGKTAVFDASFMAVRGGKVLKLNDNAGSDYTLVKAE
ncbi:MAG: hypothetical protein HY252_17045 [Sphingobacteriales bacterium]|nr:hypothetical protein [Sphingobacteriales bacterium]